MNDCRSPQSSLFIRIESGSSNDGGSRPGPAASRCGRLGRNLLWLVDAARRVVSRALNAVQGQARGLTESHESFRLLLLHVSKHGASNVGSIQNHVGAVQHVVS